MPVFSASEVYKILGTDGTSLRGCPHDYFVAKTGPLVAQEDLSGVPAVQHGNRCEPGVTRAVEDALGLMHFDVEDEESSDVWLANAPVTFQTGLASDKMLPAGLEDGFFRPHEKLALHSILGASPDYVLIPQDVPEYLRAHIGLGPDDILTGEWKAPYYSLYVGENWNCVTGTQIPRKYMAQMQAAMYACGSKCCVFCAYLGSRGAEPRVYMALVYASELYFEFLEQCLIRFRGFLDHPETFPRTPDGNLHRYFTWSEPCSIKTAEDSIRVQEIEVRSTKRFQAIVNKTIEWNEKNEAERRAIFTELKSQVEAFDVSVQQQRAAVVEMEEDETEAFEQLVNTVENQALRYLEAARRIEIVHNRESIAPPPEELFEEFLAAAPAPSDDDEWGWMDAFDAEFDRRINEEWKAIAHHIGQDADARSESTIYGIGFWIDEQKSSTSFFPRPLIQKAVEHILRGDLPPYFSQ